MATALFLSPVVFGRLAEDTQARGRRQAFCLGQARTHSRRVAKPCLNRRARGNRSGRKPGGEKSVAVWSAATGLRASPTCAASPRQQEQEEAKWRRIRGGVERSDRIKGEPDLRGAPAATGAGGSLVEKNPWRCGAERQEKRGGGITAASHAAGRDHCDGINSHSHKIAPSLLERQEALRELEIVLGDAATSG